MEQKKTVHVCLERKTSEIELECAQKNEKAWHIY